MEAESLDHEARIRKLEQRVPDLACELKLLGALTSTPGWRNWNSA
jgi:hypothetical protein